jgi:hypothetical protein
MTFKFIEAYLITIILLFLVLLQSCKLEDEVISKNANQKLSFSTDIIFFDTIFTNQTSTTRRLKVINNASNAIEIDQIILQSGSNTDFKIIVNGQSNQISKLLLRGKDSILVLINANLPTTSSTSPYLATDTLNFIFNGIIQKIPIVTWGLNTKYYNGDTLIGNTVWDSTKARFIYKSVFIPAGSTLNILEGTKIYTAKNQSLIVAGKIQIDGNTSHRVLFSGARTEAYFDDIPAQWKGIQILPNSINNKIEWAEIKNAETGIFLGSSSENSKPNGLKITNTIVKNCSKSAITAFYSDLTIWNSLFYNYTNYGLEAFLGGKYQFYNNTFANSNQLNLRNGIGLFLSYKGSLNESNLNSTIEATIINNIIWGSNKLSEIILENKQNKEWLSLILNRNLIRSADNLFKTDTSNFWNIKPDFIDSTSNFSLKTTSFAKKKAKSLPEITIDIKGNPRGINPTIGAYE